VPFLLEKAQMKFLRLIASLLVGFSLAIAPVSADQSNIYSPNTGTVSGLTLTNNYNSALNALSSCSSGAIAPSNTLSGVPNEGQCWVDTSATRHKLKFYEGSSWLIVAQYDLTLNIWEPPVGGGSGTIASAATTDLGSLAETYLTVSGTTTITSLGATAPVGNVKFLKFTSAGLTLTYNAASLIIPGAVSKVTQVGDTAIAVALGSGNWQVIYYYNNFIGGALSLSTNMVAKDFSEAKSVAIASAATTNIWTAADGNYVHITGTTTITNLGTAPQAGARRTVVFDGNLTLTQNDTSLILPGGVNIPVTAGDVMEVRADTTTNMIITNYMRSGGVSVIAGGARQSVQFGPVNSSTGAAAFLPATSASLTLTAQNIAATLPLIVSAAQGYGDVVAGLRANPAWASLTASSTLYLYINGQDGTTGFTTLVPIYQYGGIPAVTTGQFTFNVSSMTGYMGNGATAPATPLVFVGEAVTGASTVTSTVTYAYNGVYDSGFTASLPAASGAVSKSSNLGVADQTGLLVIECTTTDNGYAVGDRLVVTNNAINVASNGGVIFFSRNTVGFASTAAAFTVPPKAGGVAAALTVADWKYKLITKRAW